jgi:hypothetical protein
MQDEPSDFSAAQVDETLRPHWRIETHDIDLSVYTHRFREPHGNGPDDAKSFRGIEATLQRIEELPSPKGRGNWYWCSLNPKR